MTHIWCVDEATSDTRTREIHAIYMTRELITTFSDFWWFLQIFNKFYEFCGISKSPQLLMVMSIFDDFFTDRKPSVSAFDRWRNHRKWTSPSKVMGPGSWGLWLKTNENVHIYWKMMCILILNLSMSIESVFVQLNSLRWFDNARDINWKWP